MMYRDETSHRSELFRKLTRENLLLVRENGELRGELDRSNAECEVFKNAFHETFNQLSDSIKSENDLKNEIAELRNR